VTPMPSDLASLRITAANSEKPMTVARGCSCDAEVDNMPSDLASLRITAANSEKPMTVARGCSCDAEVDNMS